MLQLLRERGVRIKPCSHTNLADLHFYSHIEAPAVIRKRTEPGFAVTCHQGPVLGSSQEMKY
jgi:hypothetical protein